MGRREPQYYTDKERMCSMVRDTLVVGVAGGSASGKSTLCEQLTEKLGSMRCCTVHADTFFKRGNMPQMISPVTGKTGDDFNTPEAVDYDALLASLIERAESGSFDVIFVDGVTVFCHDALREQFDLKLFVDLDTNIRMYRRIKRNMAVRGLTLEQVADYFTEFAVFSEMRHALPTKIYADVIVNGASFDKMTDMLALWLPTLKEGTKA